MTECGAKSSRDRGRYALGSEQRNFSSTAAGFDPVITNLDSKWNRRFTLQIKMK